MMCGRKIRQTEFMVINVVARNQTYTVKYIQRQIVGFAHVNKTTQLADEVVKWNKKVNTTGYDRLRKAALAKN
jgi:hypothetical protein